MSIFTISLRIRAIDPIVIEKPNERARKTLLSIPSSSLTYKLWGPSAVMARPLPNPLVSPQKFIFLLSLMRWSHWTTLLSPAAWAGFQMHFPGGTSRGKASKTAGFPEHQPAAAYLKPGETPNCTGRGWVKKLPLWEDRSSGNEIQSRGIRRSCYPALELHT